MSKVIITGAFDCGKTTVINRLRELGFKTHVESPKLVMNKIGDRTKGHDMNRPLEPVLAKDHFCPVCNPDEFTKMCLDVQYSIEKEAVSSVNIFERGFVDIMEFYTRMTGRLWTDFTKSEYDKIFLLDVMTDTQVSKWGKTKEERTAEAMDINKSVERMYTELGYRIIKVPVNSVEKRVKFILSHINE
jgi:Predicted ATPase